MEKQKKTSKKKKMQLSTGKGFQKEVTLKVLKIMSQNATGR